MVKQPLQITPINSTKVNGQTFTNLPYYLASCLRRGKNLKGKELAPFGANSFPLPVKPI